MAIFDDYFAKKGLEPIYTGNPPTTESDYNERVSFPTGETKPAWSEVKAGVDEQAVINTRRDLYFGGEQVGDLSSQLEKLFNDIDAGKFGADAKTGEFYTFIKNIKDNNPKP